MTNKSNKRPLKAGILRLDSKNTRIPADKRSEDQRVLLHQLLEKEDVRGLAASIAKLGLHDHERMIVMPSGSFFVVLEGNRRLAAARLLLNPELAPTSALVKVFRKLSSKADLSAIGEIDVLIVNNRLEAAPIIASLHIGNSKRRWSSLQQARFYREWIDEGQTPAEIADEAGVTVGQVNSHLRAELLHRIALTLEYTSDEYKKIVDAGYPLTTLERFLESKVGQNFLGITLDGGAGFAGKVHPERFKAVLKHIALAATKSGITRKINKEEDFRAYVDEVEGDIPKTPKRGSFTTSSLLQGGDDVADDSDVGYEQKNKRERRPKKSKSVIPAGFRCTSKHDRVRAIFDELKKIDATFQRNSSGVMLRVLLDIAIWNYCKDHKLVDIVIKRFDPSKRRRKHNPNWTPPLRDLVSYLCDNHLLDGVTADEYKSIRTLAAKDADYFITIEGFNAFTHNTSVTPTEGDLRALWQRAEPLLKVILK